MEEAEFRYLVKETPPLTFQAVTIMEGYSDSEKIKNIDKIIQLYKGLAAHNDSNKQFTLEALDALYDYVYYFLAVAIFNIGLLLIFVYASRHKNAFKRDAENTPRPLT